MAKIPTRVRRTLPKDPVFRAGYDQGYLDISNSVLTFFEQKFMGDGADKRPEAGTPEYDNFLRYVGEISSFLKEERKKAQERVNSSTAN